MLKIINLSFDYNKQQALNDINLTINNSEIVGFIGPSGSGKSTLLKIIASTTKRYAGDIIINDLPLSSMKPKTLKKNVSFYNNTMPGNMDEYVYDFILLARLQFKKLFSPFSGYDIQATEEQINHFNLADFSGLRLSQLPNSILKRTLLAHILNRESHILVLDNPDCELDIKSMSLFRKALIRYVMNGERTIIMASNNINFISQTADRVLLMDQGKIVLDGPVSLINAENLKKYFNVEVIISHNIYNGKPEVHFFPEN